MSAARSGIARIKAEYLIPDHSRELNLDFVSSADKAKFMRQENHSSLDKETGEPPHKKLKGQNKHRPREARISKGDKLCLKLVSEENCPYGETCCYSHDISSFLAKKPPNIGDSCYVFEIYGRCPFSFTCQFGTKHVTEDFKNIINKPVWSRYEGKQLTQNSLSRDLQMKLRKKLYDFGHAAEVLRVIKSGKYRHFLKKTLVQGNQSSVKNHLPSEVNIKTSDCPDVCGQTQNIIQQQEICAQNHVPLVSDAVGCTDVAVSSAVSDHCQERCRACAGDSSLFLSPPTDQAEIRSQCVPVESERTSGCVTDADVIPLRTCEKKRLDFQKKLYLAPLTTVGNLPFRRICKEMGAEVTCGENALVLKLLQGHQSEWALLKRHESEDIFGVQVCGAHADQMTRCAQMLSENICVDFVDINLGCPIDLVYKTGAGCGLMSRPNKLEEIVFGMSSVLDVPLTVKMRTGVYENKRTAHNIISRIGKWRDRVALITLHGRSREQRYTKLADWAYIEECAKAAHPIPFFGCGDILSYEDVNHHLTSPHITGVMIARGALIKPWIFTEIKEQRHWDISSSERFDIIKRYTNYGLEHWGSDVEGVEKTRRFLLEWLSFLCRYIPVGLLEQPPQAINERPPYYRGRDDLEMLMASQSCADWIKISEMLLGKVPENFIFLPKHKANAYQ